MHIVTSSEFDQHLARYKSEAQTDPVIVMKNGQEEVVIISPETFHRFRRMDRVSFAMKDVSDETLAAILSAKMPPEYDYLNAELDP